MSKNLIKATYEQIKIYNNALQFNSKRKKKPSPTPEYLRNGKY